MAPSGEPHAGRVGHAGAKEEPGPGWAGGALTGEEEELPSPARGMSRCHGPVASGQPLEGHLEGDA